MPLTVPDLDDRRYADLLAEARALIPTFAPEWTDHNPSDPGITLIELFAYLAEMQIYRLNRVTDAHVHAFLSLLNGPDWRPSGTTSESLAEDIRATVLALRKRERAVTCDDFEALALEADERVARARCLARRHLLMDPEAERAGHISVIVVPRDEANLAAASESVEIYLDARRLLTTQLHVVGPRYVNVTIQTTLAPFSDQRRPEEGGTELIERVVEAVNRFFHPLEGGEDGQGWPFGRNVFVSEIYQLLDGLTGVDYVSSVTVNSADPGRRIVNEEQELVGIAVRPYELVDMRMTGADVTV